MPLLEYWSTHCSRVFFGEFPQAHADGALWEIGVLYGPHGAPDFFTADSIKQFFATAWEVHYNSNRLGSVWLNLPELDSHRW